MKFLRNAVWALALCYCQFSELELVSLITNQVSLVGDLNIDDLVEHLFIFFNQGTGIIAEKGAFA